MRRMPNVMTISDDLTNLHLATLSIDGRPEDRTFICSGGFKVICNKTKPLAYIKWGDVIQHFIGEDMVHWIGIYFKKTTQSETDGTSMLVCHEMENSLI